MPIIITVIIAIFLILIGWSWHNLGSLEKGKKIGTIIVELIIIYLLTLIIFNISTNGINYTNPKEIENVRNMLVTLFTFVNGLIVMPMISKIIYRVKEDEITKDQATKKLFVVLVIFAIILFFECGYLKNIQQGILNVINANAVSK